MSTNGSGLLNHPRVNAVRTRLLDASRLHLDAFLHAAGQATSPHALVLDAGAGDERYRHHFAHANYESADFAQVDKPYAAELTYVCDLSSIPVSDGRFDAVVLTQVLEHLPEPVTVLRELRRVMKPGGTIWVSCPFYFIEHEQPYDFYRYTQFALRRMFAESGFDDVRVEWLGGYWATVGYQLYVLAGALPRWLLPAGLALKLASAVCNQMDLRQQVTSVGHPLNYTVVANAA